MPVADTRVRVDRRPRSVTGFVWAVLIAALLVPVAHGCHGADEDHEPSVAPPARHAADPLP